MYLLDTHILLWWLEGDFSLPTKIRTLIENPSEVIWVSAVSSWEIVIKKSLGKLEAPDNLDEAVKMNGFKELPIKILHTQLLKDLPPLHSDPFDRLLIVQALSENLKLITMDQKILAYPVNIFF